MARAANSDVTSEFASTSISPVATIVLSPPIVVTVLSLTIATLPASAPESPATVPADASPTAVI